MGKFDKLSSETKASNPYWDYKLDRYEMPNGKEGEYHYVETPGSVMVIPITHSGDIIMTRQYRYLNSRVSYEFPGGGIKIGESAEISALNELAEEAGFKPEKIRNIGRFNPFNGVTNEICNVYLAAGLEKFNKEHDESEEFEVVALSRNELENKIADGTIWDGMTLAAWCIFKYSKM